MSNIAADTKELTVWKFNLQVEMAQMVEIPKGAKILRVAEQHGIVRAWALVDPSAEKEMRKIVVMGTGHTISPNDMFGMNYVNTFFMDGGKFVFHAFSD